MSAELVFKMGEYSAFFPTDRMYAKNHMWAQQQQSSDVFRFGLSGYAVRLLQDVYFLDLVIEPGMVLSARQEI
ncbi:MAG: glycine cleavage system protein H, partial [Aureliella sp.]